MVTEPITLAWWVWLIAGLALMLGELLVPTGFFLFFFGAGCAATALLAFLGLSSFVMQGLAFIGVSLLSLAVLRKPMLTKFHFRSGNQPHDVDSLVGETAKALETIAPQAFGKVELRGAAWSALNAGPVVIAADARCRVEKVDGLTLHVQI